MEKCIIFAPRRRINKDIIGYASSAGPYCEVDILFSKSTSIPKINANIIWLNNTFQSLGQNNQLCILTNETIAVLQCVNVLSNYKLQGAEIITVPL